MPKRQIDGSDSPSCAVLVLSCDGYRDLWRPFFTLFQRHWPDCELPVFLGTETASFEGIRSLHAPYQDWSRRLGCFLQTLHTEYILLLLEDFFLDRVVSSARIQQHIQQLHALQGASLRLFPRPPADYFESGIGVIHTNAAYRVSLQASIWNREHLLSLLTAAESPWEFEWNGTIRSRVLTAGFYCVREPVIQYRHVVERGEWFRSAARYYAGQQVGCDFQSRNTMSAFKACRKAPVNLARRAFGRLHSRWLCLTQPEEHRHAL